MKNVLIKRINKHSKVIDVFYGTEGWQDWARYAIIQLKGEKYLKLIRGTNPNRAIFSYVSKTVGV